MMTKFEFLTRAQCHYANATKDLAYDWSSYAKSLYETAVECDFLDTPEEYVDEELSYWTD